MPAALLFSVALWAGPQQPPATPAASPPAATTATPAVPDDLPVSLDRIQRALSKPVPIQLKEQSPVFRLEVFGKKPTLEDILGEKFWIGPTPYGGMTHQEFLDMVTPKLAQPYAGFTGGYLVAEMGLALAEQWALKQALRKYHDAKEEREREAARKEVMDALTALEKARREAGLPEK
ncbi:MAG: hypothetical protein DMF84_15865 [Acidobacteria bacterium]|nr:MAG: hypothetical protein DMF84_15865 [Acidobacteriota bacterium]